MNAGPSGSTRHMANTGLRRLLRLVARPVRRTGRRSGPVLQAYRGFGHDDEIFLMGRVVRQMGLGIGLRLGGLAHDIVDILRRFLRRGIGGALVEARFGGAVERVTADSLGYFRLHMRIQDRPHGRDGWHAVELALIEPKCDAHARGWVYIPPNTCRFVVISDIDDTVMFTGVANKLKMLWRLFVSKAESRLAFPGAGALYRALYGGVSGFEHNPMLYVSRGPWSIYEVLETFFNLHCIPVGPILFLREWGVTLQHPLPKKGKNHKRDMIDRMLSLYDDMPFVLIGDSGQHDPEIYARIVKEHRSRVLAVYIRNISRDPERIAAIEALAKEVADAGSSLVLAADSHAMAEHAADLGLIPRHALAAIEDEQRAAGEEIPHGRLQRLEGETAPETHEAVEQGRLEDMLTGTAENEPPESVAVDSGRRA